MPATLSYGFIIPIPLDPNPKDVYHADFIPISRGYSVSGMKF